jgi:hypothetical protein
MRNSSEMELIELYKARLDKIIEDAKAASRTKNRTIVMIRRKAAKYNPLNIEEYLEERKPKLDELRK